MASLMVFYESMVKGRFEWHKESVLIGRGSESDIDLSRLGDLSVSREHARIDRIDGRFEIRDVGATNPIYVNGVIVSRRELIDGDEICIGKIRLVFTSAAKVSPAESFFDHAARQDNSLAKVAPTAKTTYMPPQDIAANLRSFQISRQRLLALYDLSRQFFASANLPDLLQTVLGTVCRLTKAKRAFAAMLDGSLDEVTLAMGHNMVVGNHPSCWPVSRTILEKVVTALEPVLLDDAMTDPNVSQVESIKRLQLRSVICCPLVRKGKLSGLIYADNLVESSAFSTDDLDLLRVLLLHVEAAMPIAESHEQVLMRNAQLQRENRVFRSETEGSGHILGKSPAIKDVLRRIQDIATIRKEAEISVLITGETGTGKELVAREIHATSARKNGPFVTVNCAAIPESLIEAELFGIERGIATGVTARSGLFEEADGGVIFLDEIGDMNLLTQAKILRVVQNRSFIRVGASTETEVDVWIVAATNKNLQTEVKDSNFREDLYYRLKVLEIVLPPLREHGQDIEQLALHFLAKYSRNFGKDVRGIEDKALQAIKDYNWPGNVRELEHVIAGSIAFCHTGILGEVDLPSLVRTRYKASFSETLVSLEEMEKQYVACVLQETDWNISQAARILDLGRQAVYQKIRKYDLERKRPNV